MRTLVNALSVDDRKGGIRTYLLNVVDALASVDRTPLTLACHAGNRRLFGPIAEAHTHVDTEVLSLGRGAAGRVVADQVTVPRLASRPGDVLIVPSNVGPIARRAWRQVVVVQAPLAVASIRRSLPDQRHVVSLANRAYHRVAMPLSVRRADRIVAVSSFLADHLAADHPEAADRIRVVPEGVDTAAFPLGPKRAPRDPPRVLFVSTLFDYKGAEQLVRAVPELRAHGLAGVDVRIVGRDPGGAHERLGALADRLGVADQVTLAGTVPHTSIVDEYHAADLFVYPSFLESFGLPPLEAMSCGVPTLVSDRASLPEVVDDAALVVDPEDRGAFAATIARGLTDDALRDRLRTEGRQRAERMTWASAGRQLADLLAEVRA